jgi:hypothetical protein
MSSFREQFPPWHVEEVQGGFRIIDNQGFDLAYIYCAFHDGPKEPGRGKPQLTRGQALRLAKAICWLATVP